MPTERKVIERLKSGSFALPPLRFEAVTGTRRTDDQGWDLLLQTSWKGQRARFAAQCKAQSTPKAFDDALRQVETARLPRNSLPLIVLPYLRDTQLEELERRGISGLDLCGNGVVIAPGRFCVFRSGARNQFPTYAPIKNIYRRNTSMVARAVLADREFKSVQAVHDAVNGRNLLVSRWGATPMGLGTVSKALKGLEEDLIVERVEGVRLLQADKLLDKLQENYQPTRAARRVSLKVECGDQSSTAVLRKQADEAGVPLLATGLSSVAQYAVMQRGDVLSAYCPRLAPLLERLPAKEDERFPNVELIETDDEPPYFAPREAQGFLWASPEQTYLELMAGDKRDRETAEQVRDFLLRPRGGSER